MKNRKKCKKNSFRLIFCDFFFHYAKAISLILRIFYLVYMSIFNEIPIYFDEQSVTFWELPKGTMNVSAWNSLKNNYILNFQRKKLYYSTNMVPCQIHWTIRWEDYTRQQNLTCCFRMDLAIPFPSNFWPLIPNPASVFVLHVRISRKVTSKFGKFAFSTLLGALPCPYRGSQNFSKAWNTSPDIYSEIFSIKNPPKN